MAENLEHCEGGFPRPICRLCPAGRACSRASNSVADFNLDRQPNEHDDDAAGATDAAGHGHSSPATPTEKPAPGSEHPSDPWAPGVRASDVPITPEPQRQPDDFAGGFDPASNITTSTVLVTFFADATAQRLRTEEVTLPELARRVATQTAVRKADLPLLKLASFGSGKSTKGSLRTNANLMHVTGIEVEHDAGDVAFDAALAVLRQARIRAVLYTTPSYAPGINERWRALLPLSQKREPGVREAFVARVNGLFDGKLAPESYVLSQAYYYGHVNNPNHRVEVLDGDYLDLRDDTYAGSIFRDGSRVGDQAADAEGRKPSTSSSSSVSHEPQPVNRGKVEAALAVISSDCSYGVWLRVAAGLRHAFGEAGFELFDQWSSKATGSAADGSPRYTAAKGQERWRGARTMTDITTGTIFHYADKADPGWRDRFRLMRATGDVNGTVSAPLVTAAKPFISATPFVWRDPNSIPRREWLYGHHLIRKFVSATIAPGGVGKSSLMIVEALAMATGRPLLGIRPRGRVKVWYWNGEDPLEEIERRIAAVCLHFGIKPEEIEGWLFVNSGRDSEIVIAKQTPSGAVIADPAVEALIKTITDNQIDVLQIDPFISSHRVTENDNNAIDAVAKAWSRIADITGAAIDLSHHSRKTGPNEVTVEDGRGASALINACRAARVLNKMTSAEAQKVGVTNHSNYFRLTNGKANLAPPPEEDDWFQMQSVELGNGPPNNPHNGGDKVGVVTPWKMPRPLDGITAQDFEKEAAEIRQGEWRRDVQATAWVGKAIAKALGLDLSKPEHLAKVKGLLKTWIACDSLRVVVRPEAGKYRDKEFVVVAEGADD